MTGTEKKTVIQPSSRTTVRLPEVLHQRAKMAAAWSGVKLQDFVARAVEEHLIHVESAMDRSPRQWR